MVRGGSASRRRGKQSRETEPARATLNAQSTRHGARPGPKLAPYCTRGPRLCQSSREREKRPAAGRDKLAHAQKSAKHTYSGHPELRALVLKLCQKILYGNL